MIGLSSSMVSFDMVRVALVLLVAIVYAAFDLFNKRDIPNSVAYASIAIGFVSLIFMQSQLIQFDLLVAIIVGALSYVLYKIGQLGAGDGYEFVSISLLLPIQPAAYFVATAQLALPFILSVFIATGYVAVVAVPIYYLLIKRRKKSGIRTKKCISRLVNALTIILSYSVLEMVLIHFLSFSIVSFVLVAILAVPSAITMYYRDEISLQMVSDIYPRQLEEGDFIATNFMDNKQLKYFIAKYKGFGRLATSQLISEMKKEKKKIPVYSEAVPLATITLIGVAISLLFGNILLNII